MGRFAPTPSGRMHLGNVLSCLVAWLGAKSAGGQVLLRIEDLDPRAQDRDVAEQLMDDLLWLGIPWDGEPVWQSERGDAYDEAIERLGEMGLTYPCFCSRAELHAATAPHAADGTYIYEGTCRDLSAEEVARRLAERPAAIRVRVPETDDPTGTVVVEDAVYGRHEECLARECGDFLVRRSDGVVAYQLAVVVDDAAMGVTQVVRGRDLLSSAARQSWLARQLGAEPPSWAHVPLMVAPDGRRLSKRDRDLDLGVLRERGTRPEAIVSFLARKLGLLSDGDEATPAELAADFSFERIRNAADIVVDAFPDR